MKTTIYSIFISLIILIWGCSEDSPLSDIVINDPALLKPEIKITLHKNSEGEIIFQTINAFLYDKNNNTVQLKNGGVFVNGMALETKNMLFSSGKYYSLPKNLFWIFYY